MFLEQQSIGNGVRQRRREPPGPERRSSTLPYHEEQDRKKPLSAVSQEHAKEPKCSPGWTGQSWLGRPRAFTPFPPTASSSLVFQTKSASLATTLSSIVTWPPWLPGPSCTGRFGACGLEAIDPCPWLGSELQPRCTVSLSGFRAWSNSICSLSQFHKQNKAF